MSSLIDNLHQNTINEIKLEEYVNQNLQNLYDFFLNQSKLELIQYKHSIKNYISNNIKVFKQINLKNNVNLKFITILAEACEKLELYMEFPILYRILKKNSTPINKKLEAISLYMLNINRLTDYENIYKKFIDILNNAFINESENKKSLTIIFINFYLKILKDFGGVCKSDVDSLKTKYIEYYKNKYYLFLDYEKIDIIFRLKLNNYQEEYNQIQKVIATYYQDKNNDIDILEKLGFKTISHMTHIGNLNNILEYGLLAHNNSYKQVDISNKEVNSRRDRIDPIYKKPVHYYVPFYFNPRNAMLYRNQQQFKDNIIILEFDNNIILSDNVIFTNANAATDRAYYTDKINTLLDKNFVNFEEVFSDSWNNYGNPDYVLKQTMMAEILIPKSVSCNHLKIIYCKTKDMQQYIKNNFIIKNIEVIINPKIFF